jgi:hypothetical protein
MSKQTKSRTSPKGGNRACLCQDSTYRKECCNGDLQNQGIGSTVGQNSNTTITNIDGTRTIVSNNG